MSRYKLFIKKPRPTIGYDDVELNPDFSKFIFAQERIDVQNRVKMDGSLVFGGDKLGAEYETLLGLRELGKIAFWVQQFNGVDYTTLGEGYLITDAEWDDNSRMVEMSVETFTQYEIYDNAIDTEVSTEPQDFTDVLTVRRWDNKFKTKYSFSPIKFDETSTINTNANENDTNSAYQVLFDEDKDKIDYAQTWQGPRWGKALAGSHIPQIVVNFKTVKSIKEIRLYADSKWDLKQGVIQLLDSSGAVITSYVEPPVAKDPAFVPHESIHTFTNTINGVKSVFITYAELTDSDDWYYPIEYEFFSNHEDIEKTTNNVTGDLVLQGARSLRMALTDLFRANQTPNQSSYNPIAKEIQFNLFGTELFDALIIPSGTLRADVDDYEDISLSKINQLLNQLLHKYIRIPKDVFDFDAITGRWESTNDTSELLSIKDIDYKENLGIDLTQLYYDNQGQLINWSKNLSKINIENLDKPRFIRYRTESKNDNFKTIDINFSKSIIDNEMLEIPIDPWAFDIEGLLALPDDFNGKFFLAKCTIESEVSHYTQLNNLAVNPTGYITTEFDLLNGAPWTDTTLTSFTLTNNSVGFQSCETNTFSVNARDTVRVDFGDSTNDLLLLMNFGGLGWQQFTNINGVAEVTVKDSATVKIAFVGAPGTYTVNNISVDTVIYDVVETDGVENKDFSISKLLDTYIAEMPYNKATFNGFTDIDVNQKPDRQIKDIMFPLLPLADSIDMDQGIITDQGVIQPTRVSQQFNGDFAKLEGKFFKDDSFNRITEEGDNRITEEGDNRITE